MFLGDDLIPFYRSFKKIPTVIYFNNKKILKNEKFLSSSFYFHVPNFVFRVCYCHLGTGSCRNSLVFIKKLDKCIITVSLFKIELLKVKLEFCFWLSLGNALAGHLLSLDERIAAHAHHRHVK